jgi:hypothetical protein
MYTNFDVIAVRYEDVHPTTVAIVRLRKGETCQQAYARWCEKAAAELRGDEPDYTPEDAIREVLDSHSYEPYETIK